MHPVFSLSLQSKCFVWYSYRLLFLAYYRQTRKIISSSDTFWSESGCMNCRVNFSQLFVTRTWCFPYTIVSLSHIWKVSRRVTFRTKKKSKPKFARNHSKREATSRRCFVRWELEFARRTRLLYHQINLLVLLLLAILDCTKTWDHPSNLFWACGSVFSRSFCYTVLNDNGAPSRNRKRSSFQRWTLLSIQCEHR